MELDDTQNMEDGQNPERLSFTGLIPLSDLGSGEYNGMSGGLYPNGSNDIPENHLRAGLNAASQIQPLRSDGIPDPEGKIVFLAVGMSNTGLYFDAFRDQASRFKDYNPQVCMVNGALEGKDIDNVLTATDPYWRFVFHQIKKAHVNALQVQAIWFMQAQLVTGITVGEGLGHMDIMTQKYIAAIHVLRSLFPNLKQVFSSAREYGGYSAPGLGNPEPYAYLTGWAWKKLIELQINGDPQLQFEGPLAKAPWLAWSNYFWADGGTLRSDGLNWIFPDDFEADGVHPSTKGKLKAGSILFDFFSKDATTSWFRK